MADVFISYSRKDIAFARILTKALENNLFKIWIDWQDIPPSTEWLAEVYEAIEQSDTFIFIISQASVESDICNLEISHAAKNNKRLIPVVVDETEPQRVTPELASLNWLFFRQQDEFSRAFKDLIDAIQTDYAWVKQHSRMQIRALEWERNDRESGYLLRGRDFTEAEGWLAQAEGKEHQPTALQHEYIEASRKSAKRRRRITVGVSAISVVIIIAASLTTIVMQRRAHKAATLRKMNAKLSQAVSDRDEDAVQKALKAGAAVNTRGANDRTPLHEAAFQGDRSIAKLLIDAGANLSARDKEGWTPLYEAAFHNMVEIGQLLLDSGVDLNKQDAYGEPVLHAAASNGSVEMAKFLLEKGADVNALDDYGETPLHEAAAGGHPEMAKFLLEKGADVNAQGEDGETPLRKALASEDSVKAEDVQKIRATAEILRQHGGVE